MNDLFMKNLFAEILKKMQMEKAQIPANGECKLVIDGEHPVLLRYDSLSERVMLIGTIDIEKSRDKPGLFQRLLRAGLNPLRGSGPGVGIDEKSGQCLSYITFPRRTVNAELVCREIIQLVEWGKRIING